MSSQIPPQAKLQSNLLLQLCQSQKKLYKTALSIGLITPRWGDEALGISPDTHVGFGPRGERSKALGALYQPGTGARFLDGACHGVAVDVRDVSSACSACSASFIDAAGPWATADGPLEVTGPVGAALGGQSFQKPKRASSEGNVSSRIEAILAAISDLDGPGFAPDLLETRWPLSAHGAAEEDVRRRRAGRDVDAFPMFWVPERPGLPRRALRRALRPYVG